MTVIAYRDGIMAADALTTLGTAILGTCKKIIRCEDGNLAAAAGDAEDCELFNLWIEKGGPRDSIPAIDSGDDDFDAFIVDGKRRIWMLGNNLIPMPIEAPFYAIGCGQRFAIGAMEMGATAEQAVAVAIKHSCNCGGPIQVEALA